MTRRQAIDRVRNALRITAYRAEKHEPEIAANLKRLMHLDDERMLSGISFSKRYASACGWSCLYNIGTTTISALNQKVVSVLDIAFASAESFWS